MTGNTAIVGAGLIGRLLALELGSAGWNISVFERDTEEGTMSCAYTGAGMLAPYSEMETADELVFALGKDSTRLWSEIITRLSLPVFTQTTGTLAIAHANDAPLLEQFHKRLIGKLPAADLTNGVNTLDTNQIEDLEPSLLRRRFHRGLYMPFEGQIDNRQLLVALKEEIKQKPIIWQCGSLVSNIDAHEITIDNCRHKFDMVIDCRGLCAREDIPILRGVRGEIIDVYAPEVILGRPIRLMHPRYPIYIVPRQGSHFLIGATSIESDDSRPTTVQSALELLSAAFSVHSGFAEGSIMEMRVNCRPALPDNLPRIFHRSGLIRINGLYRHGFLLAPKMVAIVRAFMETGQKDPALHTLFTEESKEEQKIYASHH